MKRRAYGALAFSLVRMGAKLLVAALIMFVVVRLIAANLG